MGVAECRWLEEEDGVSGEAARLRAGSWAVKPQEGQVFDPPASG
jgi:hypothetical protein